MPLLQELYEKWQSKGLVVLAIHVGGSNSRVTEFMQNHNLSLPVILDDLEKVSVAYRIQFVPTHYFIDKNGVIRDKVIGAFANLEQLEDKLKKITGS